MEVDQAEKRDSTKFQVHFTWRITTLEGKHIFGNIPLNMQVFEKQPRGSAFVPILFLKKVFDTITSSCGVGIVMNGI